VTWKYLTIHRSSKSRGSSSSTAWSVSISGSRFSIIRHINSGRSKNWSRSVNRIRNRSGEGTSKSPYELDRTSYELDLSDQTMHAINPEIAITNSKTPKQIKKIVKDDSSVDVPWLVGGPISMIGIRGWLSIPSLVKSILYSSCNYNLFINTEFRWTVKRNVTPQDPTKTYWSPG